jgi:type I restriction enzyme S subunit
VFASYLIRLKTNADRLLPDYLCAFLNAPLGRRQVMRFATRAVSQTNVNASNLRAVLIPLPPLEYQRRVIEYVELLREARRGHRQRAKAAAGLARGVANDMLRLSR